MNESDFVNMVARTHAEMAAEHARRLDCEFLGIDPDARPTLRSRLHALRRRSAFQVKWRQHDYRERVAKRVAPWLLNDWEASERYEVER